MWTDIERTIKKRIKEAEPFNIPFIYDGEPGLDDFLSDVAESQLKAFRKKGYKHGTAYLENLSERLFTNIELWLKTGIIAPKTISLLERVFREIGRLLKRIALGWADKTVTNISKMIMIRQYSREKWEQYWKEKLDINEYFDIKIVSVKLSPCENL